MLREILSSGKVDPEALERLGAMISDPDVIAKVFVNFQRLIPESSQSVNWNLAKEQGVSLAKAKERSSPANLELEISKAFEIASLWLQEATDFSPTSLPKNLTRSLWVADAMPLFQSLSEPIANRVSEALSENLGELMPPELAGMPGQANGFFKSVGATIFAMQLGQTAGTLSEKVVLSSELGIPLSTRPGFVTQNLETLLSEFEGAKSELLIYLAARELAAAALFAANPYLREAVISQIREFAAGLNIDMDSIRSIAEGIDISTLDQPQQMIEVSSALMARSEEQEIALSRIETTLALIEGWIDSVANQTVSRLPSAVALAELYRRRRSAGGVGQQAFAMILGLELTPRLVRECEALWTLVQAKASAGTRDRLISHPDQLPSLQEIQNPEQLLARISGGDDWDEQLKRLLGE